MKTVFSIIAIVCIIYIVTSGQVGQVVSKSIGVVKDVFHTSESVINKNS